MKQIQYLGPKDIRRDCRKCGCPGKFAPQILCPRWPDLGFKVTTHPYLSDAETKNAWSFYLHFHVVLRDFLFTEAQLL
jgi:hypothetical protein